MAKVPNWTKEEVEYLKSVWEDMNIDVKHIENKLGRTKQTLSAKARKLGLSRGHHSIFSLEELEILKTYYPIMSAKELKDSFLNNKTEEQIMNAGYNHKIKKTDEYLKNKQIEVAMLNLQNIEVKSGENHPSWVERLEINCDTCGKPMLRTEARLNPNNYCSKECLNKAKIENAKGENNPNWRGGYRDMKSYGRCCILQWKKDSMKECNYRCIITGDKSFEIHHIKSFDDIFYETIEELDFIREKLLVNEYSEEQLNKFSKKLIENHYKYPLGVCIKEDIHCLFHSIYGRGYNTIEQWNKFIDNKEYDIIFE